MNVDSFFRYSRERYRIFQSKERGLPRPWTKDKVLQEFRFCNIFREDDKVTRWFKNNYREANRDDPNVALATIVFRWFNKIETGEILVKNGLLDEWNSDKAKEVLRGQKVIFTGAYIINSPYGMNKLDGVCYCIDKMMEKKNEVLMPLVAQMLEDPREQSLVQLHKALMAFERLGPFMAYEVVTDLRYTHILHRAKDRLTWANPGPGAARGLCRVHGHPLDHWNRYARAHVEPLQEGMRELLELSKKSCYWPQDWPQWEMREVEHTLCEFDKWERVTKGEGRMKQTYKGKEEPKGFDSNVHLRAKVK